jgi:hypothetical protein
MNEGFFYLSEAFFSLNENGKSDFADVGAKKRS